MILPPPRSTLFPTRRSSDLSSVYNSVKQKRERVGRMVQMHANDREEIKEVLAGDIAAAIGLKNVTTGDTLCDEDRKSTRLNSSHVRISYAVFCLKKKKKK